MVFHQYELLANELENLNHTSDKDNEGDEPTSDNFIELDRWGNRK